MLRFLRSAAVTLLVAIMFVYPLLAPVPHRIDQDHVRLIRVGMNEADVHAVFGVPPGAYDWAAPADENGVDFIREMKFRLEIARPGDVKVRIWMSRHGIFFVEFDGDGHVLLADGLGKTGRTRIEYPGWGWLRQVLEKRR